MPSAALQLTPSYIGGIQINRREKKIRRHFILPLEKDVVVPSFSRKNIIKPDVLKESFKEGMSRLQAGESHVACLIPETSLKAFVFDFDALPVSSREREDLFRFRVKKQMPLLQENVRLSYDILPAGESIKSIVALISGAVAREYEDFFQTFHLKVKALSVPTMCLLNFTLEDGIGSFILANLEEDVLTLVAVVESKVVLYRQKPFAVEGAALPDPSRKRDNVIKEIDTTARFIRDRTGKKMEILRLRAGFFDSREDTLSSLEEGTGMKIERLNGQPGWGLNHFEREILSPLIGQIG